MYINLYIANTELDLSLGSQRKPQHCGWEKLDVFLTTLGRL